MRYISYKYICFFVLIILSFIFIIFSFNSAQAKVVIWQVGDPEDPNKADFIIPKKSVITYHVPSDWQSLLDQAHPQWGDFPAELSTQSDDPQSPRELRINYAYPHDYHNPSLMIYVTPLARNPNCNLEVAKPEILIDRVSMRSILPYYEFPIGFLKGGEISAKNEIIIRYNGTPDNDILIHSISLYIDETDSDDDGVPDGEENESSLDARTAVITRVGRNPHYKKRFILHIQEPESTTPYFRNVRFIDPNTLVVPENLTSEYYFPYDFLAFQIDKVTHGSQVAIQISYEYIQGENLAEIFSPFLRCYAYQNTHEWREIPYSFLDSNTVNIEIVDEAIGDCGKETGTIDTMLAFAYPQELDAKVEKRGCFLHSLSWRE